MTKGKRNWDLGISKETSRFDILFFSEGSNLHRELSCGYPESSALLHCQYSQIYYFLLLLTLVLVIGLNLIIFRYICTYNRDIKKQRKKISLHISCTIRKRQCYVYPFRRKPRGKKRIKKLMKYWRADYTGQYSVVNCFSHPPSTSPNRYR